MAERGPLSRRASRADLSHKGRGGVFSALPNTSTSVSVKLLPPPRQSRGDSESCLASRHRVRGRALYQSSDSDSKSSSLSE